MHTSPYEKVKMVTGVVKKIRASDRKGDYSGWGEKLWRVGVMMGGELIIIPTHRQWPFKDQLPMFSAIQTSALQTSAL